MRSNAVWKRPRKRFPISRLAGGGNDHKRARMSLWRSEDAEGRFGSHFVSAASVASRSGIRPRPYTLSIVSARLINSA